MQRSDVDPVVFDLGGTTMKDHGEVAAAFHHALESHGVSSEPEAFDVLRGRSKRDAIRRLLLAERGDEPSAVLESRVEEPCTPASW